jgi:hypothetical protein
VEFAHLDIHGELMPSALKHIAETYDVVIGLEFSRTWPYDGALNIHLKHASLADALDAAVKAQPRFSWQRLLGGTVRVLTADAPTPGDVRVNAFEIKNLNLSMCEYFLGQKPEVVRWLRDNGYVRSEPASLSALFAVDQFDKPIPEPEDAGRSFTIRETTFREDLNEITASFGLHFWMVYSFSNHGVSIHIPRAREIPEANQY